MLACASLAEPVIYQRRQPEKTTLYQAIVEHLPAFLAAADEAERPVPKFVRREFEAFLDCGLVERGAIRVRCSVCGFDRLVAFSCKSRSGLCSSCAARRMLDVVTHLCAHVIPEVPVRQWVITVPAPVRYLIAYNAELLARITSIFVHAVFAHLRQVAWRELDLPEGAKIEAGAVCVPQRFNSALGLSPHFHLLAADGVWIQSEPNAPPTFRALPEPSQGEIAAVAWATCERTVKLLQKRGLWADADAGEDSLAQKEPLLAALATASINGMLAMGPNAGQRPMRLFGRAARSEDERYEKGPKNAYGFDLHAGARASASDRKARERLCKYLLRAPLSNDRLTRTANGQYTIALKRIWDDGTAAIVVTGQELLARLALLVPPPRAHTTKYFGAWAPRSKLRRLIVPCSPAAPAPLRADGSRCSHHQNRYRLSWAQALAKSFDLEISQCPRCGEKGLQQIAVIRDAGVLHAMLASIDRIAREARPP
jgi:Putative transposase/Transposase zinc-binding domain